jgi:outer membrane protein assembly factor BamB
VFGDKIFLTCYSGYSVPGQPKGEIQDLRRHVVCLDRKSGEQLWIRDVPSRLPDATTIREEHGYATSTPVAEADRLYVFFGASGVFAFDHTGQQLWHADVGSRFDGWGSAASPNVIGDLVLVNASIESESLVALNKHTGKEVWRLPEVKDSWNMPQVVDVDAATEIVVAMAHKLLGIDPLSGKILWTYDTNNYWYMVPTLVAAEGTVFCTGGRSGYTAAVRAGGRGNVTDSHGLWRADQGSNVTSPIIHDGHLYWMNDQLGIACCADADSGQLVYQQRIGAGQVYASPVLAAGRIYYTSRSGETFVVAAQREFKLLARNRLDQGIRVDASAAIAGGCIFLRSDRHLYCIGEEKQ